MHASESGISAAEVVRILLHYRRRWLLPAIVIGGLACFYAVVKRDRWEASQAVTVRNEVASNTISPGEFSLEDEMKATQETLLEIARSRPVLAGALADVGPPADRRGTDVWPAEADVDDLQDVLKVAPPKGAEFGKTEIFYIKLRDRDRNRAVQLADHLCARLEESFSQFRDARASSMIAELDGAVELAATDLGRAEKRLVEMERTIGSSLVELRMLEQSPAGVSELNRELIESANEVRQARVRQSVNESILKLLRDAQQDPELLVSAPNTLFETQPNLKRLADGLVDVQLKTSSLLGVMAERHPQVVASRRAEETVRQRIYSELSLALHAIEAENQLAEGRVRYLEEQLADKRRRMSEVASLRVPYASLTSDVSRCRTVLENAQRQLADVRATHVAAKQYSLIHRIGAADTGSHPVGPGRLMIAMAGIGGGLLAGLGILILTLPLPSAGRAPATAVNGNGHAHVHDVVRGRHGHADEYWKDRFASVS